jgi:hypothetical protein
MRANAFFGSQRAFTAKVGVAFLEVNPSLVRVAITGGSALGGLLLAS